jgi:outer membrane biosynthesis protein TonB
MSEHAEAAATPASQTIRALRIGLVLSGRIVDEKLIREPRDITIGQSVKNTLNVPVEGMPRSWQLFAVENGRYVLRFSESMDGRVAEGDEVHTFDSLKGKRARRVGDAWTMPLGDAARGKILLGSMTLLFQFVDAPAPEPVPELPASVRGRLWDRIDPVLAVVLAVSLLVHFSVALYAYQRDRVVRTRTTRIYNETFQRPTVQVAELELEKPQQVEPTQEKQAEKPEPGARKSDEPRRAEQRKVDREEGGGGRDAEEALRLQEQASAAVDAMFGDDFSETGVGGSSGDRNPSGDLDAAMAQIRQSGARVEWGTGEGRGTRGSSSAAVGTSAGPGVEGPGETVVRADTKVTEKVPSGRIKVGDTSSIDDTTLRPEDVLRRIQQIYMDGLKRCHRELLKRDPTAGGTVTLRFAVGETGRVVRVKAAGFDDGVDRCIEQRAEAWRFGVPKDEDGEPTSAEFKISLVLQPD